MEVFERNDTGRQWRWFCRFDEVELAPEEAGKGRRIKRRRLEAVLFMAKEPLNSRKLAQLADLKNGIEARGLIRRLNQHYQRMGRAFRIEQIAGGYQMLTRPQFAGWLRRLHDQARSPGLSTPALETLAVVAYRQPILRAEIESVRGVSCGELLRQLMDRNLVRISGRSSDLGRPFLYSTTRQFLSSFGLNSLDDLPRTASMRPLEERAESSEVQLESTAAAQDVAKHSEEDAQVTITELRPIVVDSLDPVDGKSASAVASTPQLEIEDEENYEYDDDDGEDDELPTEVDDDEYDDFDDEDDDDYDSDDDLDDDEEEDDDEGDDWEEVESDDDDDDDGYDDEFEEDWDDDSDDDWDDDDEEGDDDDDEEEEVE